MTRARPSLEELNCPRCRYNLRGVDGTWIDECPLVGRCTECGLQFWWSELFRPDLHRPLWSVEYAMGRLALAHGIRTTLTRTFRPWSFWSHLKMSHSIRAGRLAMYLAGLVLGLAMLYVVAQTAMASRVYWQMYNSQAQTGMTITSAPAWHEVTAQALTAPMSWTSPGPVTYGQPNPITMKQWRNARLLGAGRAGYPSPLDSLYYITYWQSGLGPVRTLEWIHWLPGTLRAQRVLLPLVLLIPLGFATLPVTRRRCKVHWGHIGRVAVYSMGIPAILAGVGLVAYIVSVLWWEHSVPSTLMAGARHLSVWGGPPLFVIWWAFAVRRYMRMPHAWLVAVLLTIMSVMLVLAAHWLIWPEWTAEQVEQLWEFEIRRR